MRVTVVRSGLFDNPVRVGEAQRVTPNAVPVRVAGEQLPQTSGCPRLIKFISNRPAGTTARCRPVWSARRRNLRWLSVAALSTLLWLGQPTRVQAERSVSLSWNRSQNSTVTGYYVYAYEENSPTPTRIDVGNTNQVVLPSLKEGLRYTFTITAHNGAGTESPPSDEALVMVPVPLQLLSDSLTGLRRIEFPGAPGRRYELQASTDLKNWNTLWQSGQVSIYGTVTFEDPESAVIMQRFYRLLVR